MAGHFLAFALVMVFVGFFESLCYPVFFLTRSGIRCAARRGRETKSDGTPNRRY